MCIMATAHSPTSTRLYSVPVTVDGAPNWTCLLYTNDMRVGPGEKALMIVPFPNTAGNREVALVDIGSTRTFRDALNREFEQHELTAVTRSQYLNAYESVGGEALAAVVRVGNYKCSVVFSAGDLWTKVDWAQFSVPADLSSRLSAVGDPALMPPNVAFVVAEAVTSVKRDGFGVAYPGTDVFFPTCHEGPATTRHQYDTCCYAVGATLPAHIHRASVPVSAFLKSALVRGFSGASSQNGRSMAVHVDPARIRDLVSFAHLYGGLPNMNVVGSPKTVDSVSPGTEPATFMPPMLPTLPAPPTAIATHLHFRPDPRFIQKVIQDGTFFAAATDHYPHKPGSRVSCDACGARDLVSAFGYGTDIDVCLTCAASVSNPHPVTPFTSPQPLEFF